MRELISNSNDALEKLRLTGLTDKSIWDGSESLNVSIKTVKNEDGPGGRIIITGKSTDPIYVYDMDHNQELDRYWYWNDT